LTKGKGLKRQPLENQIQILSKELFALDFQNETRQKSTGSEKACSGEKTSSEKGSSKAC